MWMKELNKFRVIDFFCGVGGLFYGFFYGEMFDYFESIFVIDNNVVVINIYNVNFGLYGVQVNIEEWVFSNIVFEVDVVIGGFLCQGFSLLNKNCYGDY